MSFCARATSRLSSDAQGLLFVLLLLTCHTHEYQGLEVDVVRRARTLIRERRLANLSFKTGAAAASLGDRSRGFTTQPNVATTSQLLARLEARRVDHVPHRPFLGQGVTDYDRQAIEVECSRQGLATPEFIIETGTTLATRAEVHKHSDRNVIISDLEPTGDHSCQAHLNIHNDNELLLDHQAGLHVQGMDCIEAARQMFLASTTRLGLADDLERPYFVVNSMTTPFHTFLFPLPMQIEYANSAPARPGSPRRSASTRQGIPRCGSDCTTYVGKC